MTRHENAVLQMGDQVLLAKSEDSLQYSVYNLNNISGELFRDKYWKN